MKLWFVYLQNKVKEYRRFSAEVKQCFEESKRRYGAVKIFHKLNENGIPCSIKRVQRHMQRQELRSVVVKKYNHKANQGKVPNDKEKILNRNFKAETVNQKRVTGITYIYVLKEGWTYLASVMDLHDRKIIGYAYGKRMTADLDLDAVKNACLNVKDIAGIILREEIYLHIYQDFEECRKALFEYWCQSTRCCTRRVNSVWPIQELRIWRWGFFDEKYIRTNA